MTSISVIILTFNEEQHIARALESAMQIATSIFVVDSFSSDNTVDIALSYSATVAQHSFVSHSKQLEWALETLPIKTDWIFRLDADEIIEPDLAVEILAKLPELQTDIVGIHLKRKHIFLGRWIRHGGRYPLVLLRIWRRGRGRVESRWMDEHVRVSGGNTITFDGSFCDHNLNNLSYFTNKHNDYATREAIEVLNQQRSFLNRSDDFGFGSASKQASTRRYIKENLYNRLPFEVGAVGYFTFRYLFQLGFLDGREGLIYHFLQGFWYRFLVGAKVLELGRSIEKISDPDEIKAELTRLTGLQID